MDRKSGSLLPSSKRVDRNKAGRGLAQENIRMGPLVRPRPLGDGWGAVGYPLTFVLCVKAKPLVPVTSCHYLSQT